MAAITRTKVSRQAQLRDLVAGIGMHLSSVTTVTLGGVQMSTTDVVKLFQQEIDAMTASVQARAAYSSVVQQERATRAKVSPTLRQFKSWVLATFGDTQDSVKALADFGITPRKVTKPSTEVLSEAQAKSKATRKARGTTSQKAKEQIHGDITPAAAPTPAGSPAPKA
jgi:predicted flavoprotein YhiN